MYKFDIADEAVRSILLNLVGDIYLYAKENNLHVVNSVREVEQCFRTPDRKPNNELALNHESFIATLFARVAKKILDAGLPVNPADPQNFRAIAELLDDMSDEAINRFVAFNEMVAAIHESGDKKKMDAFFSEMEEFAKIMRKLNQNNV